METIKQELEQSRSIYERRMAGEKGIWSATTKCRACGEWWLWGVEENLNFTCPKCENFAKNYPDSVINNSGENNENEQI